MDISPRFGFTPPNFRPWNNLWTEKAAARASVTRPRRAFRPVGLAVHASREMSVQLAKFGALESILLKIWWSEKKIIARRIFAFHGVEIFTLPLGGDLHFAFLLSDHGRNIF